MFCWRKDCLFRRISDPSWKISAYRDIWCIWSYLLFIRGDANLSLAMSTYQNHAETMPPITKPQISRGLFEKMVKAEICIFCFEKGTQPTPRKEYEPGSRLYRRRCAYPTAGRQGCATRLGMANMPDFTIPMAEARSRVTLIW